MTFGCGASRVAAARMQAATLGDRRRTRQRGDTAEAGDQRPALCRTLLQRHDDRRATRGGGSEPAQRPGWMTSDPIDLRR